MYFCHSVIYFLPIIEMFVNQLFIYEAKKDYQKKNLWYFEIVCNFINKSSLSLQNKLNRIENLFQPLAMSQK